MVSAMSTFTAILTTDPDGTLHLPVPVEWRDRPIRIKAELEPVSPSSDAEGNLKGFGALSGMISISSDFDEPLEEFREYMG